MSAKSTLKSFLTAGTTARPRRILPLLAAPGIQLLGLPANEVHRSGQLQFECIRALSELTKVDVLVTFMDLSVEAEAFGCTTLDFASGNPEIISSLAQDAIVAPAVGAGRTGELLHCAELCASQLPQPVLGGMIGPFSLACRLLGMTEMMLLAASEPDEAHAILDIASDFLGHYLAAQRACGLSGAVIAEPAAGLLSPAMCQEYSASYLHDIIQPVQDDAFGVILHNCGQTAQQVAELLSSGAVALHVGNAVNIVDILGQVPSSHPVLGNLDPASILCLGTPDTVRESVFALLNATVSFPNHILSTGCDVPTQAPLPNIEAMIATVNEYNAGNGDNT